jgi:glycosyltransferase involved in cell wall biosynthesis
MTKTVWMINHFATTPDAPGGTRHHDFGVELAKRGYEVTIFAADFNYMLCKRMASRSESDVRFVWIRTLRYKKNNWRRAANMLSFALNLVFVGAMRRRPDVIIGSSPHLFAALSAYLLAKLKGSRFYLEVRDLWPQVLIDMGAAAESSPSVLLLRKIEALLYRRAERIIVLSEGAGKYIARRGVEPERISLLPNGVYLEQFEVTENRESVRSRMVLADKFVVMYAGAHGPANALDTIIQAAVKVKNEAEIVFVLVGDGACKDELRQMVTEENLGNVKMLPAVPKSSLPNLLNAADALIITLRSVDLFSYGVSPNKLFEYMAIGKPILCAVGGEVANMVKKANAGVVVEPENPDALAQAVITLAENRDKFPVYGANGRKFVEENFSRSRMAEKLASMLDA